MKNHTHNITDHTIERLKRPEEADSTPMYGTRCVVECIRRIYSIHCHFHRLVVEDQDSSQ
jgi:hypothetical protein